jgi:hypothetical protein
MDVTLERHDMTVVQMQPEWARIELIREIAADWNSRRHTIHARRMDAVEMDGVRHRGSIPEAEPQQVVLPAPEGGTRNLTVVGPGGEEHARRHLDFFVNRDHDPFAQGAAIGRDAFLPPVEVIEKAGGIEGRQIHIAH